MNSYQKLKARIAELENDIHTIVRKGDTVEGVTTFLRYKMKYDINDALMFGEPTGEVQGISGLLHRLTDTSNEQRSVDTGVRDGFCYSWIALNNPKCKKQCERCKPNGDLRGGSAKGVLPLSGWQLPPTYAGLCRAIIYTKLTFET